jgi:hypothetical protein
MPKCSDPTCHVNTTGSNNVGIGYNGGFNRDTGDNNIEIGNVGQCGRRQHDTHRHAGDADRDLHRRDLWRTATNGCTVAVDSSGLLGCPKSSARYKRDIRDMVTPATSS